MATASEVISLALKKVLVQGSEASLEADEYQDAIFILNNLMAAWEADGIDLNYTTVENLGDTVTVAAGALQGVIANLAIRCAPQFNGTVSDALVLEAKDGLQVIRKLGMTIVASTLPNTLPQGSGNNPNRPFFTTTA